MPNPIISVVIPLFNHEKYIEEALLSVLSQTFEDFEIVVVDDGSTDASAEIVFDYSDDRIRYFFQENAGAHEAINKGVSVSKGKFVSVLNSDDVYSYNRLEKCICEFEKTTSLDAVFTGIDYIDANSCSVENEDNPKNKYADGCFGLTVQDSTILFNLLGGNFLKTTSNLFCRKECFAKIGPFRNLRYTHDYDFFLKLAYDSGVKVMGEPLLKYRIHPGNTLKEDQAAVDFESALVVSHFLLTHDLGRNIDIKSTESIVSFFSALNTFNAGKVMLVFSLFAGFVGDKEQLFQSILNDPEHPFRKTGRDFICNYHDGWQAREEIYQEWHKLHALYLQSEEQRQQAQRSLGYRIEKKIRYYLEKMTGSI